jgi:hypothetical protein
MSSTGALGGNLLIGELPSTVSTAAAQSDTLASDIAQLGLNRDRWQEVIDTKLIDWGRNPDQLAEVELIPPSRDAVRVAVRIAGWMRSADRPPPSRVVPDGDGGIVMERWEGVASEAIEIDRIGHAQYVYVRDHHVVKRISWPTG